MGVYMTLANISPWLRSKKDHIQLVSLFFEKDIKKFGMTAILEPLIIDLKILENKGILIKNNIILKGTLIAVTGDNLGSHQIGGFSENFNISSYFCRYCYENNFEANVSEKHIYRDINNHKNDVLFSECLNRPYKGVKSRSVLNSLMYYHVCAPGLPPCIAHDLFEGVVQCDLILIIKKLVKEKKITYDYLNQKINEVKFHQAADNQALPEIKHSDKISGTATQVLHLVNILPFLLYESLDELQDEPAWELLLILRKICNLTMSLKISVDQIAILQSLLNEYIRNLKILFPEATLKPKHHYILHYPYLINQFGPLRLVWTLRFESKHGYFKKIIRHCPNFKNVLALLTNKHQLLQALETLQNDSYSNSVVCDEANIFVACEYPDYISNLANKITVADSPFYISNSVTFRGIIYSQGMNVCYKKSEYGIYEICKIQFIFINNQFTEVFFSAPKKIYFIMLKADLWKK